MSQPTCRPFLRPFLRVSGTGNDVSQSPPLCRRNRPTDAQRRTGFRPPVGAWGGANSSPRCTYHHACFPLFSRNPRKAWSSAAGTCAGSKGVLVQAEVFSVAVMGTRCDLLAPSVRPARCVKFTQNACGARKKGSHCCLSVRVYGWHN